MQKEVRALGRLVATRTLTPEELSAVAGGGPFEGMTFDASADSVSQGKADDCTSDG
jgi:hypothetical protein